MKFRYPIIGIIILLISTTIWQSVIGPEKFEVVGQPIFDTLLLILLSWTACIIAKIVFSEIGELLNDVQRTIQRRYRHQEQQASRLEQINQELDEIEASLNAIRDEKVTPIWELPRKEP